MKQSAFGLTLQSLASPLLQCCCCCYPHLCGCSAVTTLPSSHYRCLCCAVCQDRLAIGCLERSVEADPYNLEALLGLGKYLFLPSCALPMEINSRICMALGCVLRGLFAIAYSCLKRTCSWRPCWVQVNLEYLLTTLRAFCCTPVASEHCPASTDGLRSRLNTCIQLCVLFVATTLRATCNALK